LSRNNTIISFIIESILPYIREPSYYNKKTATTRRKDGRWEEEKEEK
jgi:hypothetical protein